MAASEESWVLQHLLPEDEPAWLELQELAARDVIGLRAAFARTRRRIRAADAPLGLHNDAQTLPSHARPHWTRADVVRLALVRTACAGLEVDSRATVLRRLLQTGDLSEQVSLLHVLPALPHPESFVALAVEACRTNTTRTFAALCTHNAYPSAYFPEPAFNQMVLKALFMGVLLRDIEGLSVRNGDELRRMIAAYASERRAAGRSVPDDVEWILGLETSTKES